MAKSQNDAMLDAALAYITANCDEMIICSTEPTNYTEATATYALADQAMTSSNFTGPAAGDTSGRKITVDEAANVSIDSSGSAAHVALVGSVASTPTLLYVTTCDTQALVASNQVTIPAWDIEVRDVA